MNKTQIEIAKIFILILLFFGIESCNKDNPVKPDDPIPVDTVDLYEWRKVPFGYFNDIYVPDTSNIYICGVGEAVRWDGSSNPPKLINFNDNNFKPELVKGVDNSSIFIGGPYGMRDACVKRLQNNIVTETYYFDTANYVNCLFPISPDEIWITFSRERIAHYKNGQINILMLPVPNRFPKIFKNRDGNIYVFAEQGGNGSTIPSYLNCYRIENEQLKFVRRDSLSQYSRLDFILYQISSEIIMYDRDLNLRKFSDNGWEYSMVFPGFYIWGLGGCKNDSMVALTSYSEGLYIRTWDGSRWKKENYSQNVIGYISIDLYFEPISLAGSNVYVMLGDIQGSYLLIGRRKENFKI